MPKKPKLNNRLNKLFQSFQTKGGELPPDLNKPQPAAKSEEAEEKAQTAPSAAPVESIPAPAAQTAARAEPLRAAEPTLAMEEPPAYQETAGGGLTYSLNIQTGYSEWSMLRIYDENRREWTPDEELLVKQISDQLALALENARLFDEAQRRAKDLDVLNELALKISAETETERICQIAYEYSGKLMNVSSFFITLYNEKTGELIFPWVINDNQRISNPSRRLGSGGLTDYVIRSKETLFMPEDVMGTMKKMNIEFITLGNSKPALCWLGVPLLIGSRVLGAIVVQSTSAPRLYGERERDLLLSIAGQVATAVENARLLQETQRRANEMAALAQIGRDLSAVLSLNELADKTARYTLETLRCLTAAVYLPDENEETLRAAAAFGEEAEQVKKETLRVGEGIIGGVAKERIGKIVNDASQHPDAVHIYGTKETEHEHLLVVPILTQDKLRGLLAAWRVGIGQEFIESEFSFLSSLAQQISTSLENARLYQEAQERADELALINRIVGALTGAQSVQEALQLVAREVVEAFPVARGAITELNAKRGFIEVIVDHSKHPGESVVGLRIPLENNPITQSVIQTRQPRVIENPMANAENPPIAREASRQVQATYTIVFPIIVNDQVFGTLGLDMDQPGARLSERQIKLVETALSPISTAISRLRAEEEALERANELAFINRVVSALTAATNMQEALDQVTKEIVATYPVARAGIATIDDDRQALTLVTGHAKRGKPSPLGLKIPIEGSASTKAVLETRKPYILENPADDPANPPSLREEFRALGLTYMALFPILVNDEVVGTLGVDMDQPGDRLTERQIALLESALAPVSTAISRLRAEDELRKSQEQYALAAEGANDGLWDWDLVQGKIYYSSRWKSMLGYADDELTGGLQDWENLMHPEDHDRVMQSLRDYLDQKAETYDVELRMRHKDGSWRWIRSRGKALRDESGKPLRMAGSHSDVTASKQAEEAIRRRNEYLAASSEISKIITSTLDLNTIFARTVNLIVERFDFYHASIFIVEETGFNAVIRESTGAAGAEMKKNAHSLPVNSNSIVGKVTSEGKPVVVNDVRQNPFHKPNPLLPETRAEAAIPLKVGSRIIGAIDIQSTEVDAFKEDDVAVLQTLADQIAVSIDNARSYQVSQQAVREMREADRVKSQFLANMSHELRTPLNSIIGFSRVILKGIDGPVTDLQKQDLTAIYNSGQHLLSLINDILDYSKIEAGKMELAFDEVNMADVVNSVLSTMTGYVKDKPVNLKSVVEPNLPTVRADTIRLRQVLLNLLSNAAKFTDEGDIVVKVETKIGDNKRRHMQISVTDSGPGIAKQDQEKLFQAFSQVDDSPTRKTGGTGLGLAICQELVRMHGGTIWVESEVGKGSTFRFTLPLFHKEDETAPAPAQKIILAIDDDRQVISLYERYLQPQGYEVVALTEPARAVERAKALKPFAITLDVMMPAIDGWQVLDMLKADPETRAIPIIVCSILEDQEKGFSLGAADYLTKPILEDDLLNALDRLNADGSIRDVLVIDDDPNDLRLLGKILNDDGRYKAILAEGGLVGWSLLSSGKPPHAVALDLFMPDLNGFEILGRMRADEKLRDIPTVVISGVELTAEQRKQLSEFGQSLLAKGSFSEKELLSTIQRALERVQRNKDKQERAQ